MKPLCELVKSGGWLYCACIFSGFISIFTDLNEAVDLVLSIYLKTFFSFFLILSFQ